MNGHAKSNRVCSRRHFVQSNTFGLGATALTWLLKKDGLLAAPAKPELETRDCATRCLIARRLVERGVRFVQIINDGQSWDQRSGLVQALPELCARSDQPTAAFVADLKGRGVLDSTLVHWGDEMGRLPVIQAMPNRRVPIFSNKPS